MAAAAGGAEGHSPGSSAPSIAQEMGDKGSAELLPVPCPAGNAGRNAPPHPKQVFPCREGFNTHPWLLSQGKRKRKVPFSQELPSRDTGWTPGKPKTWSQFIGKTQCPKPTWSIQDLKNCTEVLSAFLYEFPLPCVLLYSFGLTLIIHYYSQSWRSGLESQGCFGQAGPPIRFSPVLLSESRSFGGCFLSAVLCLPPAWQCPKGEELLIILGRKSI